MKKQISPRADAIATRAYQLLFGHDFGNAMKGFSPLLQARMPDISFEAISAKAEACRELLRDCEELLREGVSHDDEMLLGIVKYNAQVAIDEETFFWNRFDYEPFFNWLTLYFPQIPSIPNLTEAHAELKAQLFEECAKLAGDMLKKARGQMERGILLGKPLVKISVEAFGVYIYAKPEDCPYTIGSAENFDMTPYEKRTLAAVKQLSDYCRALTEFLSGEYYDKAPETIGLSQYPNGKAYYDSCILSRTTLSMSGNEIYDLSQRLVKEIESSMERIRREQGYDCGRVEFSRLIMEDPAYAMRTPEEFGARLNACVGKMSGLMDQYFGIPIHTPCAALRVSPELEPYYANGIYTPASPTQEKKMGIYHYNGVNVQKKNPLKTESLAYHEMIPGHHYQFTVVQEMEDLHPLCRAAQSTAYNEGWAEYAAAFAGEIGLYSSPLSEYGRLEMDLYITNYLTVDSGINAAGLTLPQLEDMLRDYLPDYPGPALTRQLMRIACGMPAFSLAYKLGSLKMQEYRADAQSRLGDRFDIREYHNTVLEWGAIPLELLKKNIDHYVERKLEA